MRRMFSAALEGGVRVLQDTSEERVPLPGTVVGEGIFTFFLIPLSRRWSSVELWVCKCLLQVSLSLERESSEWGMWGLSRCSLKAMS